MDGDRVRTRTNRSGGVQGGITNGETIYFRVGFKPTATIMHEQATVSVDLEDTTIRGRGRHDPCVLPRAVPMVEAMTALVLADHALRQEAISTGGLERAPKAHPRSQTRRATRGAPGSPGPL